MILGHEGVGTIDEVRVGVLSFHKGDKVLISCITFCGRCSFCRTGMYSHCRDGGWILGNQIDGTQAEYVKITYADTSLYALPPEADEEAAAMLSDIFPTSLECGVLNGQIKPGDFVAIVGAGPVGLATLLTAQLYSPSEIVMIDLDANRARLVDTVTTPMLLKMVQSGRLNAKKLVSHRFDLSQIMKAYDTFEHAATEHALKVVLKNASVAP